VLLQAVKRLGEKCGLAARQIRKHGLPVRPAFWTGAHKRSELAEELDLDATRKTVRSLTDARPCIYPFTCYIPQTSSFGVSHTIN